MQFLAVKNFERFQHYKDRNPPWIKLHAAVLDDYEFGQIGDADKAHVMLIWILASKMDNKIPADPEWIGKRIGACEPVDVDGLIEAGFLESWDAKAAKGKREDWASRYVSAQTRSDLLSLAQHRCAACPSTENLEIDHIVPVSRGGTSDPKNLQVLCRKCNRKKRVTLRREATEVLRSGVLRRRADWRSLEAETEAETETEAENTLPAAREAFAKVERAIRPEHREGFKALTRASRNPEAFTLEVYAILTAMHRLAPYHPTPEQLSRALWDMHVNGKAPEVAILHSYAIRAARPARASPDPDDGMDEFTRAGLKLQAEIDRAKPA